MTITNKILQFSTLFLCIWILQGCGIELPKEKNTATIIIDNPYASSKTKPNYARTVESLNESLPSELTQILFRLTTHNENLVAEYDALGGQQTIEFTVLTNKTYILSGTAKNGEETLFFGSQVIENMQAGEARKVALSLESQLQLALNVQTGDPSEKPQQISVTVGSNEQTTFDVNLEGLQNKSVIWYVNDIAGGDDAYGTITSEGVYTPPQNLPTNTNIQLKVIPEIAPSFSATFDIELIENPDPVDYTLPTATTSLEGGTFTTAQIVTLNCSETESGCAKVYFTLDGSEPSTTSTVYSDPLSIGTGTTVLKYFPVDAAGNAGAVITQAYVITPTSEVDITPPVITLNGENSITIALGIAYTEEGASAVDETDGNVTVAISGTVDVDTMDAYTISYTATDAANNSSTTTRTIYVVDATPPVITLNGDTSTTVFQGGVYVEEGASAVDDQIGSVFVEISGTVDTSTVDTYILTYSATDAANNTSTATRTVIVILSRPFITTWKTDNPGASDDNQISIPVLNNVYDYTVDWGDGQSDTNVTSSITHTYAVAGIYTVSISGEYPSITMGSHGDNEKILSIEQWGTNQWSTMVHAFSGCKNLIINASDAPDLSRVTYMSNMFTGATSLNQDLSSWDVSNIKGMHGLFSYASSFNQDLSAWDVSSVVTMSGMFKNASAFNQDLSSWDVSSVTSMSEMFSRAISFNRELSNWNVSAVTNMRHMFHVASAFNQDLSTWHVSSVQDMSNMFSWAESFNQDLSAWNVSSVRQMDSMFDRISLSTANYDALLLGWSAQSLQQGVNFYAGNSRYSASSQTARDTLTDAFGWTITDGGAVIPPDVDTTPPVITLNDFASIKHMQGFNYTEAGATAIDDVDGNVNVEISGTVDINTLDTYTITYTATDAANNSNTVTRTVEVVLNIPFVTTWKTDNPGVSDDNQITIGTSGDGYSYTVDWGDGESDTNITGNITHTYATAGTYSVSISGNFPQIFFGVFNSDAKKLLSIEQWGSIQWRSMNGAFRKCENLLGNANDIPDLTLVSDMSEMFEGARAFNQDLSTWDVSSVTDMSYMFDNASAFNQDLSLWDVSSVINMSGMFNGATAFNQDLSSWDVSSVTDMSYMFSFAYVFNQDISSWNVSAVTDMTEMFSNAIIFDQSLNAWDVSSVINMSAMFYQANAFNQDLSNWDVSSVTDMSRMFDYASIFNQDLGTWDVSSVTDMSSMFARASDFNGDLNNWNVSAVTNMSQMFNSARAFNADIGNWDVSAVTDMHRMFSYARAFNRNLSAWDVSSVNNMSEMFDSASTFNQDLNTWNVSSVTDMSNMFESASAFNGNISTWDVSSVTALSLMFNQASVFNGDLNSWDVSSVTNMRWMFGQASVFNGNISAWDVSSVTDMSLMFNSAIAFNQNLSNWDVSSVTNMYDMFHSAEVFNGDLSTWDVSSVTNMQSMFSFAHAFNQDISSWNVSSVTDMSFMFNSAYIFNQNLSDWDVSSVTNMHRMLNATNVSQTNYDALLAGWSTQSLQSGVAFGGGNSQYSVSSQAARDILTNTFGWTVTDGGVANATITTFDSRTLFEQAVGNGILEENFDSYTSGESISQLFGGKVSSSPAKIFFGGWDTNTYFQGGSLLPNPTHATPITFTFTQPVKAIGAYVFDDGFNADNITLTVTSNSGESTSITETGNTANTTAGFLGVSVPSGIGSATFSVDGGEPFELDHLLIVTMP